MTILLRNYAEATTVSLALVDPNSSEGEYLTGAPAAFVNADVKLSKDEANDVARSDVTIPIYIVDGYVKIELNATDMTAKRITVKIVDQTATKEWVDNSIMIDTMVNALSQHETFPASANNTPIDNFMGSITDTAGISSGTLSNTQFDDNRFVFLQDSSGMDFDLNFNVGTGIKMKSADIQMRLDTTGEKKANIRFWNFNLAQYDTFGPNIFFNNDIERPHYVFAKMDPDYTDANGDVRMNILGIGTVTLDFMHVFFARVISYGVGEVPSGHDSTFMTTGSLEQKHGHENWNGQEVINTRIGTSATTKTFVIKSGTNSKANAYAGMWVYFFQAANPFFKATARIKSYNEVTGEVTLENEPIIPIADFDSVRIMATGPADIFAFLGNEIAETVPGLIADNTTTFLNNAGAVTAKTLDDVGSGGLTNADKPIIAQAMKDTDIGATALVPGSVIDKLLSDGLSLTTMVTTTANLGEILELSKAIVNNRYRKDFPAAGQLTLYKDDGTTILSTVTITATERTP
ncbi:MAG: hypothetical protein V3V00_15940 [Saprospiraceae bacterium]